MMTELATRPIAAAERPEPQRKNRRPSVSAGDKLVGGVSHGILMIWSALVILPLIWTAISSFKTSEEVLSSSFNLPSIWRFDNYVRAWTNSGVGVAFFNSMIVVLSALVLVMLLGAMCAYVLARFKFFGSQTVYVLMLAGLTFPIFLAIVPLFFILQNMGLLGTYPGLILTFVAFALPFTVFFLFAFFKSLPFEIAEAAAIDGAGEWRTFFQIMLPMAKPGMASVAILNAVGLWNQYLLAVALNAGDPERRVLSQALGAFAGQTNYATDYGALFAAVMTANVPVLVLYVIFQRQLQGSVSQGTSK